MNTWPVPVPGPQCTSRILLVAIHLQTCHPPAVLHVDPHLAVLELEGPCRDVAPCVKEARVLSLALFLALELFLPSSWPWHAGSPSLFQPLSDHTLSQRDFPGKGPQPEPAGRSQGAAGFSPRKPRLQALSLLPESLK